MKKFLFSSLSLLDSSKNGESNQVATDSAQIGDQHTKWLNGIANDTQQAQESNNYENFLGFSDPKFTTTNEAGSLLDQNSRNGTFRTNEQQVKTSRFLEEEVKEETEEGTPISGEMHYAFSKIGPNPELEESQCSGNIKMYQMGEDPVMLRISLQGLSPAGSHVISVHDGDSIEGGCSNAGAPLMTEGTYTVLQTDADGAVVMDATNPVMNIIKDQEIEGKVNVLGKTIVIHEKDDISSGEAGGRLCCGTIDYVEEVPEDQPVDSEKIQEPTGDDVEEVKLLEDPTEGEDTEGTKETGDDTTAPEESDPKADDGEAGDEKPAEEQPAEEEPTEGETGEDKNKEDAGEGGTEGGDEANPDKSNPDEANPDEANPDETGDGEKTEGDGSEGNNQDGKDGEGKDKDGKDGEGKDKEGKDGEAENIEGKEKEEVPEEPKIPVDIINSHSALPDSTIAELVRKFADISASCEKKNCVLEQDLGVRAQPFGHKTDNETGELTFFALSQKYEKADDKQTVSIVFTDYTKPKDGELTPGTEVVLIKDGSKPQLWKTGSLELDPILIAYEAPASGETGNQIYVNQYDNLDALKAGEFADFIMIPRSWNSRNEGSPTIEFLSFTGNIRTSTFTMFYEYQNVTGPTHLAKGKYSFNPRKGFKWEPYPSKVNDIFLNFGFLDTFGSRSKFMFGGHYFYLMEATKYNMETTQLDNHIALCDSGMVPLALIPFKLPEGSANITNFFSPKIYRKGVKTFAITFQEKGKGEDFQSDWNEIDNYAEKTLSLMYFIEKEYVTTAPPVSDEDKKRKRKVREDTVMITMGKAVVNQVLSYMKTIFWSLRLIK